MPRLRRHAALALALALFVSTGVGCSSARQATGPLQEEPAGQEMIGFRFSSSRPPLKEQDPGTKLRYDLGDDGVFRGTVELHNLRADSHDYVLTMYVDYVQVPFIAKGGGHLAYASTLGPKVMRWIEFEVGPLGPGTHDVSMVAVSDLADHDLSELERWESGDFGLVSARANVMVGGVDTTPSAPVATSPLRRQKISAYDGAVTNGAAIERPILNFERDDYPVIAEATAAAGEPMRCFVHVANKTDTPRAHLVFPTLDGIQCLDHDGKPLRIFTVIPPGEIQTFEIELPVPNERGRYELQVLDSVNPFSTLTDETFGDSQMQESIRIGLTTR